MVYSPYSMAELEAIIGLYLELKSNHVGNFAQLRLMDFDKNIKLLSKEERNSLFLYGICNLTSREAATIVGLHHSSILDRYTKAKDKICKLMNGEDEH